MAQTVKLKRSSVSGNIPLTSQLELGEVAINTFDGKMYIKKDDGTEQIIEVGYNLGVVQEYIFTASASQTIFTGLDNNSIGFIYNPGNIQVFLNGILLDNAVDYTQTSSTTLTLSEPADAGDTLQVFSFNKKIGDGKITVNSFTGNGSSTQYTLSVAPEDVNNISVYIDGIYQSKSNYTISGTTLDFGATPPPLNTSIEVEIATREVSLDTATGLVFADNVKAKFGNDDDLEIYHDGSNSIINDTGTGNVRFQVAGSTIQETTAAGIDITGNVTVSGTLDVDTQTTLASVNVEDLTPGRVVLAGTSGELQDNVNLTFDGATLAVTGDVQITQNLKASLNEGNIFIGSALNESIASSLDTEVSNLEYAKVSDAVAYAMIL